MSYLLKLLLYGILIYYVIRFFGRLAGSLFGDPGDKSRYREREPRRPEGDVRVESRSKQDSRIRRDEGEYVDFEEIE